MLVELLFAICLCTEIKAGLFDHDYVPNEEDVTFHLYDSEDLSYYDHLFIDDCNSIDQSRFNYSRPTKIIIHGWTHGRDVPWVIEMREAMANLRLWNIIVVDWAPLSHTMYAETRQHIPLVSTQVAKFLITLQKCKKTSMSSIHLIGHSMGGQISAYASYIIGPLTKEKIGRITGLDPAYPLFEWPEPNTLNEILDPSDATFVDVIHTNAGHLGMVRRAGHVDYYPNGGDHQPGCGFWVCSHMKAVEFWTASIRNPYLFKAYPYETWDLYLGRDLANHKELQGVPMGIAANPKIPNGAYFLETHNEEQSYLLTKTTIFDSYLENFQ